MTEARAIRNARRVITGTTIDYLRENAISIARLRAEKRALEQALEAVSSQLDTTWAQLTDDAAGRRGAGSSSLRRASSADTVSSAKAYVLDHYSWQLEPAVSCKVTTGTTIVPLTEQKAMLAGERGRK